MGYEIPIWATGSSLVVMVTELMTERVRGVDDATPLKSVRVIVRDVSFQPWNG